MAEIQANGDKWRKDNGVSAWLNNLKTAGDSIGPGCGVVGRRRARGVNISKTASSTGMTVITGVYMYYQLIIRAGDAT